MTSTAAAQAAYNRAGESALAFGEQLRAWREGAGLTQAALARKLNVTQQTVSDWEAGDAKPRLERAIQLADELVVGIDDVLAALADVTDDDVGYGPDEERLLSALHGVERLTPERRAQLIGYLERLLEEQDSGGTK